MRVAAQSLADNWPGEWPRKYRPLRQVAETDVVLFATLKLWIGQRFERPTVGSTILRFRNP